jgi:hypothetical protein
MGNRQEKQAGTMVGPADLNTVEKLRKNNNYFYLNGHLCKRLRVIVTENLCHVYDFVEHKRKVYPWSTVKRLRKYAFTPHEVGLLLNRSSFRVRINTLRGNIPEPQSAYPLTKRGERKI